MMPSLRWSGENFELASKQQTRHEPIVAPERGRLLTSQQTIIYRQSQSRTDIEMTSNKLKNKHILADAKTRLRVLPSKI